MLQEMTDEKVRHLLALSGELHWAFLSSQGTPIIRGHATSRLVEQAVPERESYANAARVLLENGDEEGAVEIVANAWRLLVLARDVDGGRAFLATVLDKGEKRPSRARSLALYGDALLAFTHILTIEERNLVAPDLFRKHRLLRNLEIIIAAIFLVSVLPLFWTMTVDSTSLRFVFWVPFFVRRIGNLFQTD